MFGFWRIRRLERELKELRDKYYELAARVNEIEPATFERVGRWEAWMQYRIDPRPKLTAMAAVKMVMAHLGLQANHIDAMPSRVELIVLPKEEK